VVGLTVKYQKRFDGADLAAFLGAFFSGTNIPAAIFLTLYSFMEDPLLQQTKLKDYQKYITMAGLALLLTSILAIWKLCKTATEIPEIVAANDQIGVGGTTTAPAASRASDS
jgi:hypothetical protein